MRPIVAVLLISGIGCAVSGGFAARVHAGELMAGQPEPVNEIGSGYEFRFDGMSLTGAEPSVDGLEMTLHFKEPVKDTLALDLTARSKGVLAYASGGYDTLLLRAVRPAQFDITEEGNGFTLRLVLSSESSGDSRLQLVEIRRRTMIDDTPGARSLLSGLRLARPDDNELFRLEADIDMADRDHRTAAGKYQRLLRDNPADTSLYESLSSAQADFAPRLEGGADYQDIEGGDRQWRGHLYGQTPLSDRLDLRGRLEFVDLDDERVQFSDGTLGAFEGERLRGELTLAYDFGTLWEGRASLFGGNDTIGMGAAFEYQDADSELILSAGFLQPSWDYTESIVANGTRDFAAAGLQQSFDDRWFFNLAVALNRFALDGDSESAISSTLQTGLRWQLPLDSAAKVSIGYAFDAEFVDSVTLRLDGLGDEFAVLPIGDRAVHSADVRVAGQLSAQVLASIYVGYSRDFDQEGGAIAGIELIYEPIDGLQIALNANYSNVSSRAGESGAASHAGLTVSRRFSLAHGNFNEK